MTRKHAGCTFVSIKICDSSRELIENYVKSVNKAVREGDGMSDDDAETITTGMESFYDNFYSFLSESIRYEFIRIVEASSRSVITRNTNALLNKSPYTSIIFFDIERISRIHDDIFNYIAEYINNYFKYITENDERGYSRKRIAIYSAAKKSIYDIFKGHKHDLRKKIFNDKILSYTLNFIECMSNELKISLSVIYNERFCNNEKLFIKNAILDKLHFEDIIDLNYDSISTINDSMSISHYGNKVGIDHWNNIHQPIKGYDAWVVAYHKQWNTRHMGKFIRVKFSKDAPQPIDWFEGNAVQYKPGEREFSTWLSIKP